jgi:hypothetical protein
MALLLNVTAVAHRPTGSSGSYGLNLLVLVTASSGAPYGGLTQEHFHVKVMPSNMEPVDGVVDHVNELARQNPAKWPAGLYAVLLDKPNHFFSNDYYSLLIQVRRFPSSGRGLPDQGQTLVGVDYR